MSEPLGGFVGRAAGRPTPAAGDPPPDYGAGDSPRHAAEWGLGSALLGGVLLLMGPPTLLLFRLLEVSGYSGFPPSDRRLAAVAGYAGVALAVALSGVGVGFGGTGLSASRRAGGATALPLAGLLLSGFALLFWLLAAVAWHSQAWNLL